ncbi:hypothetical protein [Streptomyces cucumeris]|uniref:hypothetical protein n=1 Tax=Streptomyces cucumeris TaxID=2962890 RepID=UPI0020C8F3C0|nr:hypothetical protein [Streptomyces sp. NEAU-Y11]MCP9209609.1 hypothetical protein [Streptomyces sp. NEAU-Y11]
MQQTTVRFYEGASEHHVNIFGTQVKAYSESLRIAGYRWVNETVNQYDTWELPGGIDGDAVHFLFQENSDGVPSVLIAASAFDESLKLLEEALRFAQPGPEYTIQPRQRPGS